MPADQNPPTTLSRRRALQAAGVAGAGLAGMASLAACTDKSPHWQGAGDSPSGPAPLAGVTITAPASGATKVPASAEIVFTTTKAVDTKVELADADGNPVDGAMHPDGAGWLPDSALAYGQTYTAKVTATGTDGLPATATTTFTVMAQPSRTVRITSFLPDDAVLGTGMVLIMRLSRAIPTDKRADLQRMMMVETDPVQEGVWTWFTDREMHWRPKEFWQANSKINVRVRAGGLPLGDGYYGLRDLTLACGTDRHLVMQVDDTSKHMKVIKDGEVIRDIPVSLGRPSMPSSSGTTIIMEKMEKTIFDTTSDPNPANRYRVDIEFAQRLTFGGEFIHAAPWSVKDQGHRDVSHGCVNMSTDDAKWLFGQTMIGDPVTTKGTSRDLVYGNGWTDWDLPWEEYVKRSAIPYQPPASPEPTSNASDSADPGAADPGTDPGVDASASPTD